MNASGWRSFIVSGQDKLTLRDGNLIMENDEGEYVTPIGDIREVMILSEHCSLSVALLNALVENNVSVVMCDKKHKPSCEVTPLNLHSDSAGNLFTQIAWKDGDKEAAWDHIVQNKIRNQRAVLKALKIDVPFRMRDYVMNISKGDSTNREAQAARLYFGALFGSDFKRNNEDDLNACLNYGYSIILSACARAVSMYGYNNALGVHHRGQGNPYNLACDIMEPFRPFVDLLAYKRRGLPLDWSLKKEFIALPYTECKMNNKTMKLYTAIDQYALGLLKFMNRTSVIIGEVSLWQTEEE